MARVKICGLRSRADVAAAARAGADYAGFVFYPRSPRNVTFGDARWIASELPENVRRVGLTVNALDDLLSEIIPMLRLDLIQFHGNEPPARVADVRKRFNIPVMKAVGLATRDDLAEIDAFADVADQILVDARPAPGAELPGGNGIAFDWKLLKGRRWSRPWMLAGGLTPENVAEAIRLTGAQQVDVSSGVEDAPGHKDYDRIARFVAAARGAEFGPAAESHR